MEIKEIQEQSSSQQQQQPQGTSSSPSSSSLTINTTSSSSSCVTSSPRTLVVNSSSSSSLQTIPYSIQASMGSNGQTQLFTTTAHPQNSMNPMGQQYQFMPQNTFVQQQVMGQQILYPNQMFGGGGNIFIAPQQLGQGFQLQLQQQPNNTIQRRTPQAIRPNMTMAQNVRPTQILTQTNFAGQQVLTVVPSQPQLVQSNNKTAIINTVGSDKKSVVMTQQNIQPRPPQGQNTTFIPRLGSQIIATPTPTSQFITGPQFIQQPLNQGLWASNGQVFIRPQTDQTQIQYVTGPQLQFPINVNASNSLQVTPTGVTATPMAQAPIPPQPITPVNKPRTLAARPLLPASTTATQTSTSAVSKTSPTKTPDSQRPVKPKPPAAVKQTTPETSSANKTSNHLPVKQSPQTSAMKTSTPTIKTLQHPEAKANKTSVSMVSSSSSTSTPNEAKMKTVSSQSPQVNGHVNNHIPMKPSLQRPTTGTTLLKQSPTDCNKIASNIGKRSLENKNGLSSQASSVFTPHNHNKPETTQQPLRNGIKNTNNVKTPVNKANGRSQEGDVLIHVIEDFIIEESPKPFPVTRSQESASKENGASLAVDSPISFPNTAAPTTMDEGLVMTPIVKKREVIDTCPACHKPGLKSRLKTKDGSKVCSSCAGKKSVTINTNSTSRLDLFNPVTSSLTEYEFNEPEVVQQSIVGNAVAPPEKKKPRLSKNPNNVINKQANSVAAKKVIPIEQQPIPVTPSSSAQITANGTTTANKSPDPVAGLFIPKSGKDPMKWSVSYLMFKFVN